MSRPAAALFRCTLAALWMGAPLVAVGLSFGAVVNGHPAYPVLLTAIFAVGVLLLIRARRASTAVRRRPLFLRVIVAAALVAATGWAMTTVVSSWPHPPHGNAVAAMSGSSSVAVTQDTDAITLTPRNRTTGVGIVFQPGARTDARSYVPILTRLAERGHLVVVAKQPLSIAPLAQGRAEEAMAAHPEVRKWVAIGHSFGGVPTKRTGSSGDPRVAGVVLWATYADPDWTPTVPALVLYGTHDRAITPDRASAADTPQVRYVPVDGATHTSFSDYGPAFGDGTEGRDHTDLQAEIVDITDDFIRSVTTRA